MTENEILKEKIKILNARIASYEVVIAKLPELVDDLTEKLKEAENVKKN